MQLVVHRVHRRDGDAEHAHDCHDRDATGDFQDGVARERAERYCIAGSDARR